MEFIYLENAKPGPGHYTPAIKTGNLVSISGQLPVNPFTAEKVTGSLKEQAAQVFSNIFALAKAAGVKKEDIFKVTVYLADIALWDELNTLYAGFFGSHKPTRTVVPAGSLHYGFLLEVDALAYKE